MTHCPLNPVKSSNFCCKFTTNFPEIRGFVIQFSQSCVPVSSFVHILYCDACAAILSRPGPGGQKWVRIRQVRNRNRPGFGFTLTRRSSLPIVRHKSHCMKAKAMIHFTCCIHATRLPARARRYPRQCRQKMETGLEFHTGTPGVS